MLAQTYDPDRDDPSGWLMSEKMDGVRCYWNGQAMYTRTGKILHAPKSWKDQLPNMALDGELWSGRDNFQSIVSIVRKIKPEERSWDSIKFMIFDAPLLKTPFEDRLIAIKDQLAKSKTKFAEMIKQTICNSAQHLHVLMDDICGGKGEGVMLKDPLCSYERKRSYKLLKVKRFEDAEATVYGHQGGTGRITGMCGALLVREKDGTEFKIGSGFNDAQRKKPPKVGVVVTFKF